MESKVNIAKKFLLSRKKSEVSEKVKKSALSANYNFSGNSTWRSEAPEKSVIFQRSESIVLSKKLS